MMVVHGDIKAVELGGEPKDNLTSVVVANNTAKTIDLTVPSNKKWIFDFMKFVNPDDVNRKIEVKLWKEAAKTNLLAFLFVNTAVTPSETHYLQGGFVATWNQNYLIRQFISHLVAGNTIEIAWFAGGASAGGTDADGLVLKVMELAS